MLQNKKSNTSNTNSETDSEHKLLYNNSAFSYNQTASSFKEIQKKEEKIISNFSPIIKPIPIYNSNIYKNSSDIINNNFKAFIPFLNNVKINNNKYLENNFDYNFIGKKKYFKNNEISFNDKTGYIYPIDEKENENNSNLSAFRKIENINYDESFYNSSLKKYSLNKNKSFNKNKNKNKYKKNIIINKIIINEENNLIKNSENNKNNNNNLKNNSIKNKRIFKSIRYYNKKIEQNENQKNNEKLLNTKKRRGRKPTSETKRVHNASDYDNILRKIQVHYLTFIIYFSNDLIEAFLPKNKELKFKNLDYDIKKPVNHSYVEQLKNKTIGEILQFQASSKNKKFDSTINQTIYQKVCELNPFLKNFFQLSYLELFNEYYYKNERKFCIEGINVNISQRTKLFNDLIQKNYGAAEKIQLIATNNFIKSYKKPIFVINKK